MHKKIKSIIKNKIEKSYFLHYVLNKIRYDIILRYREIRDKYFDIKAKNWSKDNLTKIREYWNIRFNEANQYLIIRILPFKPKSILEIGSNCGNKLFLLSQKLEGTRIVGIDINQIAVQKGNEWFKKERINNVELRVGRAEDLNEIPDKSFDIIFTWAVLIYIRPSKIKDVLASMLRIAKKAILLVEMDSEDYDRKSDKLGVYFPPGNWKRDYRWILKKLNVDNRKIQIEKISPSIWDPGGGDASLIIAQL